MKSLYTLGPVTTMLLLTACAATPSLVADLPEDIHGDPGNLSYDTIDVRVTVPENRVLIVDVDGSGAATKDGFKMMAAAPVGCMAAGMFAGFCYGAAPFFPIIAAARAEDPDIVRLELGAFDAQIAAYGLTQRLRSRVVDRLTVERLPVASAFSEGKDANTVSLNLVIHSLDAHHSGYKDGSLALTIRYILELSDVNGQVVARRRDGARLYFDNDYSRTILYRELDAYIGRVADRSVKELLLEWSPAISLSAVYPSKINKRSILGFRYVEWIPVDTLTPRLSWQSVDELFTREELAAFEELTYEIEVFGYTYDAGYWPLPRIVVASALGLESPQYIVEAELLPCQRYRWAPRARFRHRGVFRTVSVADPFVLLTPGPDCGTPAWSLPAVEQATE